MTEAREKLAAEFSKPKKERDYDVIKKLHEEINNETKLAKDAADKKKLDLINKGKADLQKELKDRAARTKKWYSKNKKVNTWLANKKKKTNEKV